MKSNQFISETELIERAITLLMDNLGPVETKRFLTMDLSKRIESVKRHRKWQKELDKDQFFNQVFNNQ